MLWVGFTDSKGPAPADQEPLEDGKGRGGSEGGQDGQGGDDLDEVHAGDEVQRVLLVMLPWAVSLLLHVAVVLLALFLVWSVRYEMDEEEFIVPAARLSKTPGRPLQMRRSTRKSSSSKSRSVTRARTTATNAVRSRDTETKVIGTVGASGGAVSPFAAGLRTGSGFESSFFGTGGNAKRIVYVIDASGSLLDSLDFVLTELKRSVTELSDQQQFSVFFFQGDRVVEIPPRGMKRADAEKKAHVMKWIDSGRIIPGFGTNPVKAIDRALRYQPQLLYLLSDNITGRGIYQVDQHQLLKSIKQANRRGTHINAIQFLYPDPLAQHGFKGTMELIAAEHGGEYRFIDARELGLE